jgi:hypothetical protein
MISGSPFNIQRLKMAVLLHYEHQNADGTTSLSDKRNRAFTDKLTVFGHYIEIKTSRHDFALCIPSVPAPYVEVSYLPDRFNLALKNLLLPAVEYSQFAPSVII